MPVTVKQLAWLSGLLEGEGSFMDSKGSPCIALQSTDLDVVERAAQLFGVKTMRGAYRPKGKETYKKVWGCRVFGTRAIGWMQTLFVLLGKRRQERIAGILERWRASTRAPRAPRGQRFMATCHPDQVRSAHGLCHTCYMRKYRAKNRDKILADKRNWEAKNRRKNGDKVRAYQRAWEAKKRTRLLQKEPA